jgi:ATP-dependent helicase/nuclease subunit B
LVVASVSAILICVERIFLGWEKSMVQSAADWLWSRRDELSSMCIVVPTSQAGRRLQEALARHAEREDLAIFGLRTVTPAHFLRTEDPSIARDSIELVAWMEVLESITDWSPYAAAFPQSPALDEPAGWSLSLAQSLFQLRRNLQENALRIRDAARLMQGSIDAERWPALAALEDAVEKKIFAWAYQSRTQALRSRVIGKQLPPLPDGCTQLVIIGVTETSALVRAQWQLHAKVRILIAAPETEAEHFDEAGQPLLTWNERLQAFPGRDGVPGEVILTNDARQLAEAAVDAMAHSGLASDQVMLATCDSTLGQPLRQSFSRAGWEIYDPSGAPGTLDWRAWLRHWQRWLLDPQLVVLGEMAGFPETTVITEMPSLRWATCLGKMRNDWLVENLDDLQRIQPQERMRPPHDLGLLISATQRALAWRDRFLQEGFHSAFAALCAAWLEAGVIDIEAHDALLDHAEVTQRIASLVRRDAGFWLNLFLETLPATTAPIPENRVLDVEGWLEIPFHASPYLLVCGMDDQSVPARGSGEPWLAEGSRGLLGLTTDALRSARDAYLYTAMIEARRGDGRIDIICAKTDQAGKILRPSRFLLQARGRELAERVAHLFCEIPPSDAQLTWNADWTWQPRLVAVCPEKDGVRKLSVTALRDYLMCPFRFYLKHGLRMNQLKGDRGEWDPRDFGTIMHEVLEYWGRDEEARDLMKSKSLADWLNTRLDQLIAQWYGPRPNLALQLQTAALKQRFAWFAEVQCERRAEGWQVIEVEKEFTLEMEGNFVLRGKIDRIDHNPTTNAWMMWDYKSGKLTGKVAAQHCKSISARTVLPAHLQDDPRLTFLGADSKPQLWTNLQLPLYAAAHQTAEFPGVGYIAMGDASDQIRFDAWENFDPSIAESAKSCAQMILDHITAGHFWPPNEKVTYDDFKLLAAGAELAEMMSEPS